MLLGGGDGFECEPRGTQHRLLIVVQYQRQDLHHLPVPARALEQHRLEALEGLGKLGKRSAVPQRARLALEDTQVVAPVVEGSPWPVVAPAREHPQMLGDDLAFGANHDAFGVYPRTDRAVGEQGRYAAVAITLQGDKAGRRDTLGVLDKAVERRGHAHQMRPLIAPDLGDRARKFPLPSRLRPNAPACHSLHQR